MSLETKWSRMQSRISGVLMCDFVWKRQRGGGDAVLCTQLSGAGIHARLCAPRVLGATPVPGSWYTFPCDFRQPSFRPHSHSGAAASPPPTSTSHRGASPSLGAALAVASVYFVTTEQGAPGCRCNYHYPGS